VIKWLIAAVVGLCLLPILVVTMIFPSQVAAACATGDSVTVVAATPDLFTPEQVRVGTIIRDGAPSDANDYVLTFGVMVSLAMTNLSVTGVVNQGGPTVAIDPFTGRASTSSTLGIVKAFYVALALVPEAATTPPADLAATITGHPASTFEAEWPQAVHLVGLVTGKDTLNLGVSDATVDPCSSALMVAWNAGAITVQGGWAHPVTDPLTISSPFGWRKDPITGAVRFHAGTDYPHPCGSVIVAAADGTVIYAGPSSGYGNLIAIAHDNGFMTRYGHMESFGVLVSAGDVVRQGQVIGLVGSAGHSTGCHLHFEVYLPNGQVADSQAVLGF
jgi:murein DD-endopeptidase MepM/ murein hydrolase activator NlpD